MGYRIAYGEDVDEAFLEKLSVVDEACYDEIYWGEPKRRSSRFAKNPRQYVFVIDEEAGEVAGYLNFFPMEQGLYEDNLFASPVIRDDDIEPEEIAPYREDENHLFIESIAIHPRYQGTGAIRLLSDSFIDYLNRLEAEGHPVTDLLGTAVSPDGRRALTRYRFRELRDLDDGNTVFICDGNDVARLLAHDLDISST